MDRHSRHVSFFSHWSNELLRFCVDKTAGEWNENLQLLKERKLNEGKCSEEKGYEKAVIIELLENLFYILFFFFYYLSFSVRWTFCNLHW